VNRYREKRECQPPDFYLLSRFLLEVGNHLRPVAIHPDENGHDENEGEQESRGDSKCDQTGSTVDGHSGLYDITVAE
jgi:hypothetical protein